IISMRTVVSIGHVPALQARNPDLNETRKEGGRSSGASASRNRLRSALVMGEVAMALVLLISAGLLIKSVMRLRDVNPGFDPENRLTMSVTLPGAKYPKAAQWIAFYNQRGARLTALPGVEAA